MKISHFEIFSVEIPMKLSVKHALAERKVTHNVLVAAHGSSGGVGWGECCPRPFVTGETVETAIRDLSETILPGLLGQDVADMDTAAERLSTILDGLARNQQAAFCAAELAVLDLLGKDLGQSAGAVLGPVLQPAARYSGVIATADPRAVQQHAAFMKQFGVSDVKVKAFESLDTNMAILRTARTVFGDGVNLRIDANAAWSAETAIEQLGAMQEFNLVGVEQPVPPEDLEAMQAVTATKLVPVVADESLASLADAETLIAEQACDIFNVRISKCGGLINAGRVNRLATEAGIICQLGAQVGETGILSAAGRHFATRSTDVCWCEGSYDRLLLESLITTPDITIGPGGMGNALDDPGLGVEPVADLLAQATVETLTVTS